MIGRDLREAGERTWDLLVVGGGVYGVALTLEAARRGLRPLLVEQADFGGATTWNSLRIVHGGLRYLQTLDLHRFRESVQERRRWLARFPDLVRPLPCIMPLYGDGMHRPSILRAALAANDLLSRRRNAGVPRDRVLPDGRVISAAETVEWFPGVDRDGLKGAALWHDGAMPDSQRLIVEMLHWAGACGAAALNYVEAVALLRRNGAVQGLRAVDRLNGAELELRAPVVVNCAGPWCREVAARFDRDLPNLFPFSLAFNALLDREPPSRAALAVAPRMPGGRTYFLHPWQGRILAGTYHASWPGSREEGRVEPQLLGAFLDDLNRAIPGIDLSAGEVLRLHWGFLPARKEGTHELAVRETIRDHGADGGPAGLFSVSGVKFTTARKVAEKVLSAVLAHRGAPLPPRGAVPRPAAQPWSPGQRFAALAADDPAAAEREVRRLVAHESVVHLDDLLLRRTDWGADPRRGREIAARVAGWTGWDGTRVSAELSRLRGLPD